MNYKYETHTHTKEGSACAKWSAKESVTLYKDAGYTGIVITDHFFYGNTAVNRKLPWSEWVHRFTKGYRNAKTEGDKIGLQVFMGWESGYNGTEFLIYGMDEEWLLNHPEIKDATIEEQYNLIHACDGLIIHAHPFREESYIKAIRLYPKYVDGVEVFNASHSSLKSTAHYNPEFNKKALDYANANDLLFSAGSDSHFEPILNGGLVFDHKLKDINDFIDCIKTKSNYKLLDGVKEKPIDIADLKL